LSGLAHLLASAAAALSEAGVEFAVIGGCARNAYAPPRATRDVDVSVLADASAFARVVDALASRGFRVATEVRDDDADAVPDLALFVDGTGGRIDVLVAKTPFETVALSRKRTGIDLGGVPLPLVTVEDLLIYKLIAGRPQDLVDAEDIARTQDMAGWTIDWRHVEHWCAQFDVTARLLALRSTLSGPTS